MFLEQKDMRVLSDENWKLAEIERYTSKWNENKSGEYYSTLIQKNTKIKKQSEKRGRWKKFIKPLTVK